MSFYKKNIINHYAEPDLIKQMLKAIEEAGEKINVPADTAGFDEFHVGGREATRALAHLANLKPGVRVLDIGSGIGGPARTLAAEFGCRVTGIDLAEDFCNIATRLTKKVNLDQFVNFICGNILEVPFPDNSFDVAVTIHTTMNIENKELLFRKISHVLKPGGLLAIYEICAGSVPYPKFPLPWASYPSTNFLGSQKDLLELLNKTGFKKIHWNNLTESSLQFFQKKVIPKLLNPPSDPSLLGFKFLMGDAAYEKTINLINNLEEKKLTIIQGVLQLTK